MRYRKPTILIHNFLLIFSKLPYTQFSRWAKWERLPSSNRRFWELSGGILYCGCCGRVMRPNFRVREEGAWFYYRCSHRWQNGSDACPNSKGFNEIEETRETARSGLAILAESRQRLEDLERDRDALVERYAGAVPEALENLTPEERHRDYNMLRLKVLAYPDSRLEVNGVLGGPRDVYHLEPLSRPPPSPSWPPPGGSESLRVCAARSP